MVLVRAGNAIFGVTAGFARVPVPGEHVLLWLSEAQRAQLGAEFGRGKSVPAIVRDTVLLQKDADRWLPPGMKEDTVNLYAEAITSERWQAKMARWASGDDQQET